MQDINENENNTLCYLHYNNAWYRKHFVIGEEYKDKRVLLRFDGIAGKSVICLNGCLNNAYVKIFLVKYMKVLYSDNDIAVIIKPIGVLSQSDSGGRQSVVSLLSELFGSEIYPLHRLDKEVGGVMIYAKNKTAAARLSGDIADRKLSKEYLAVVSGKPSESGEMVDFLFKDSKKNKSYVVKRMRKGVKEARLSYSLLKFDDEKSLVRVVLHTGRTHQIRVQFADRKMSLLGDKKYGAKDDFRDIALMSYRISFNHPKTNEQMQFTAESEDFINKYFKSVE